MGQVEQVFSHAVNLLIPEQQRLLTLLSEDCDNAPNSCRLALTHYEDLFHPGEQVNFSGSGITVGNDKWIEITGCQMWRIPRWTSDSASLAKVGWQHWEEFIRQQLRSNDTLFLYQVTIHFIRKFLANYSTAEKFAEGVVYRRKHHCGSQPVNWSWNRADAIIG